jgi:hypothetical protein
MRSIMGHFVALTRAMRTIASAELQYRQLFTLSILAEIVRQEPKHEMPYTSDFLKAVFEIEVQQVPYEARTKLLALLGVLYCSLSRQGALVRELKMAGMLKQAVLENYSLVEEKFTAKLFNQCIVQMQTRRVSVFTMAEI